MRIRLANEFHTIRLRKGNERLQHIRTIARELLQRHSADRITDPEFSVVTVNELQHFTVGRQITFFSYFVEYFAVLLLVFIKMGAANVEKRIVAEPERLVYLEIKAYGGHEVCFFSLY